MKSSSFLIRSLLGSVLAFCLAAVAAADNIVEKLADRPEFSTLVAAVTAADLADTLATADDITVLAPSNAAFSQIPEADLAALLADKEALTDLLLYHVVPQEVGFRDFDDGPLETLLTGQSVDVEVTSYFWGWFRTVEIDDARITRADLRADNGVIHRIDRVLDPGFEPVPTILEIAAGNADFSTLARLVTVAGFDRALGSEHVNLTVFAPTNEAFEALGAETLEAVENDLHLLRNILRNHIAIGAKDSAALAEAGSVRTALRFNLAIEEDPSAATGLSVDGKPIDAADIMASNGIIHVVGEVLVPPTPQSLVDVALERDDLSTFVTAVSAAGLVPTFDSTRKWPAYTIFAPDNEAFAGLPAGVLDSLLADPEGALAEVLKLHVVRGRFTSDRLFDGQILRSLAGDRLKVTISEDGVFINNALVAETDLKAENGVIHILDDVIGAEPFTIADFVAEKPYLSTLQAALEAAGLDAALDNPDGDLTLFAPLDSAFAQLPEGTLEALLSDPQGQLAQILLYHVLGESLSADELVDAETATTLQGADVEITSVSFQFWGWRFPFSIVTVNGNRVLAADLQTDNGLIHLITGVLLPPGDEEEGDEVENDDDDDEDHDDDDDDDDDNDDD